jgi:hypothetical protein
MYTELARQWRELADQIDRNKGCSEYGSNLRTGAQEEFTRGGKPGPAENQVSPLGTERSMLQYGLAISLTALSVLGMAMTAAAAPYLPKSTQCYSACEAKCAAQHSCERSNASLDCFTHYNKCKAACRSICSQ